MNQSKTLVKKQIEQQRKGLGSTGKPFINKRTGKPTYSPSYAKKKGKTSPIDLHDKGDFQFETFIDIRTDTFVFDSADEKSERLQQQFGTEIFGLNTESKIETKPALQKELKQQIKQQMK